MLQQGRLAPVAREGGRNRRRQQHADDRSEVRDDNAGDDMDVEHPERDVSANQKSDRRAQSGGVAVQVPCRSKPLGESPWC